MPMDRTRYPADWLDIRRRVLERAGQVCECAGECGRHADRCQASNGDPLPHSGYFVVLTTAHLWRGPCAEHHAAGIKCGELEHLKAMCQRCHLIYDLPHHVAASMATRHRRRATGDLFSP